MRQYQGQLTTPQEATFAIIVGRFNEFITSKLLGGAVDTLELHGVEQEDIEVVWSPGSFEIPVIASRLAKSMQYDVIICLGAVIRGGTDHYQYVASEVAKGISVVAIQTGVPCIFGVLTCDTVEQAVDRAGTKSGNKGSDAAAAALEMVNLFNQLPGSKA